MTRRRTQSWRAASVGIVLGATLIACGSDDAEEPSTTEELANPASEYCVEQGGEVDIVDGPDGEAGVCVLPDGSRIDEWEYYRESGTSEP